jgi:hypothetical protein
MKCPRCGYWTIRSKCERCRRSTGLEFKEKKPRKEPEIVAVPRQLYQCAQCGRTTQYVQGAVCRLCKDEFVNGSASNRGTQVMPGGDPGDVAKELSDNWYFDLMGFTDEFISMTESEKLTKYGPVVATFESLTNTNTKYEVRYRETYSCNCKGWQYRKSCRHIQKCAADGIKGEQREDPLIKAIEETFSECGSIGFDAVRVNNNQWWQNNKTKIAKLIREKVNIADYQEESETINGEVYRPIILTE